MLSLAKLKQKNTGGGEDVGKAAEGKKGLVSKVSFSSGKEHQRAWQMVETVDHLGQKKSPLTLFPVSLKHSSFSFYVDDTRKSDHFFDRINTKS